MKQLTDNTHRSLEILIHTICWGLFFAFPLFFTQNNDGTINWNYFVFIPHILFHEQTKRFIFINAIVIIILTFGLRYWNNMHCPPPPSHRPMPPSYIFYLRDMASLIFSAGLSVAICMSKRWSQTEAELKNLRNQLNPHFLLNTLNNIYALITFDTDKAQQAVQELSKLLRYVLYDNQQMFVPLSKEIDFIRNYIELMRIRISAQVDIQTNFNIKPKSQTPIAPLIFISLIENAFKHGISPVEPSYINISI